MKVNTLKSPQINQNGYHKNTLTKERIGTLFLYPIDYTPDDCLACDGYSLQIVDYEDLYKVIGTQFNQSDDVAGTFRVPDYNVTKRFLQPGSGAGTQIAASLPQHSHSGTSSSNGAHTHTRGTMNITGTFGALNEFSSVSGVFTMANGGTRSEGSHTNGAKIITFTASRNWTGSTSSNGAHTHTITVGEASNSTYKESSTVQPPSQLVHICIKYK